MVNPPPATVAKPTRLNSNYRSSRKKKRPSRARQGARIRLLSIPFFVACGSGVDGSGSSGAGTLPNIVLVLMDDLGIDQWLLFGYSGDTPAATPNIVAFARGGVGFTMVGRCRHARTGARRCLLTAFPHAPTCLPRSATMTSLNKCEPERDEDRHAAEKARLRKRVVW